MKFISFVPIITNDCFARGLTDSKSSELAKPAITKFSPTVEKKDNLELTKYVLAYLKEFRSLRDEVDKMG